MRLSAPITVIHILPSLAVGGIETMITRFIAACPPEIDYRLFVLSTEDVTKIPVPARIRERIEYLGPNGSPLTYIRGAFKLHEQRDNLIVSSTWKAAFVVWLANHLGFISRHVAFTHRSSVAHRFDRIFRSWQVKHSLANIADSQSSALWVRRISGRCDVLVVDPIFKVPTCWWPKARSLSICFIGRLAPVKNLDTVCKLIDRLAAQGTPLVFHIYGPDAGSRVVIDHWMSKHQDDKGKGGLDLAYLGPISPLDVYQVAARYMFIVSCSHTEGFAMSVAEAMQVGTVPIVGKVGGPSTYCREDNAIILDDYSDATLESAARRVIEVSSSPTRYSAMSEAAASTFVANQLYPSRYASFLQRVANMSPQSRRQS